MEVFPPEELVVGVEYYHAEAHVDKSGRYWCHQNDLSYVGRFCRLQNGAVFELNNREHLIRLNESATCFAPAPIDWAL